jgi:RimJ/RimL family protein N-acetyltransferase
MNTLALRPVEGRDRELIFHWRNDPWIVAVGSQNRTVSREEHDAWFDDVLAGSDTRMFVIEEEDAPIGQIRFKRATGRDWEVSVYLIEQFTRRGRGVEAIRGGSALLLQTEPLARLIAYVRDENAPSRSVFRKAGYRVSAEAPPRAGHHAFVYVGSGTP